MAARLSIFGQSPGFELRKGPRPVIDGAAAYNASDNKLILLSALARDAGLDQGPAPPDYYYQVAEAGFNYVDDQCRSYFDELFFLNKGREQAKSGISAAGQTTAAILGVTGAAVPTLTIVAQAFGLASAATDIVTGTYLYALPPATTQGFVERLQLAFRDAASHNSASIRSPASAYCVRRRLLTIVLVGGGPTGVELAGSIAELARFALKRDFRNIDPTMARIILLEAGPRLLAGFHEKLIAYAETALERLHVEVRLNTPVEAIEPTTDNHHALPLRGRSGGLDRWSHLRTLV